MDIEYLKKNNIDIDKSIELLGDIETYDDILKEFNDEIENRMTKLKDYLENKNLKDYAIEVHALKSDSKYLGFTTLADMALEHQTKSEENDIDYITSHYDALTKEVEKIIAITKKYLES